MTDNKSLTHKLDNDNVVINYQVKTYNDSKYRIIIPAIILFLILAVEYSYYGHIYSLIITIPILIYIIVWKWMLVVEKNNDNIGKEIIYDILNPIIEKDIKLFGCDIKEIGRSYNIVSKQYCVTGRFVHVLLSNGGELIYDVINPKHLDKWMQLEIDTHAKVQSIKERQNIDYSL